MGHIFGKRYCGFPLHNNNGLGFYCYNHIIEEIIGFNSSSFTPSKYGLIDKYFDIVGEDGIYWHFWQIALMKKDYKIEDSLSLNT